MKIMEHYTRFIDQGLYESGVKNYIDDIKDYHRKLELLNDEQIKALHGLIYYIEHKKYNRKFITQIKNIIVQNDYYKHLWLS